MYTHVLLLVVSLTTIGIPVYTHTCHVEHVSIDTYFVRSNHCSDMEQETEVMPCCKKELSHPKKTVQKKCCSEEQAQFKVSDLAIHHVDLPSIEWVDFRPEVFRFNYSHFEIPEKLLSFNGYPQPPPLSNRNRLPLLNVWRC